MAQMGSFVPCKSCSVSCVDKIFARVGAYDDLVLGQSTFMVEMNEVSRILRNATPKSLVILDEIGRGTSTFDGLSVAWAVVEYLANENAVGAKGLVATHYRELTLLSDLKPGIANYHVTVKKSGDDIVFLRKVTKGVAEGSFGIGRSLYGRITF
ncbi:MAG: MutS-related protein [Bacillota bacterium]|jgi:DNA mismatch repair protein MutS